MTNEQIFRNAQRLGEGNNVEFKRCGNEVEHDVFESVCSFANRFGGDIYLGVLNDGTVTGVNANNAEFPREESRQHDEQSQCLQTVVVSSARDI